MTHIQTGQGIFYIVSTPIGNLQDITLRALDILKSVDFIAAEDTRHSASLLRHFGIVTPLRSLHEHNEKQRLAWIEESLSAGKNIALISDAGTPLISDPGNTIVKSLVAKGFRVSPIPGVSAVIAALSAAGLPTDKFVFEGFLSSKSVARKAALALRKNESATLIYYEAPHRLLACLEDMMEIFGKERQVVVARELTKTFEEFLCDALEKLVAFLRIHPEKVRGECVILIKGAEKQSADLLEVERVLGILLQSVSVKEAAHLAAEIFSMRKNELYDIALKLTSIFKQTIKERTYL